MDGYSFLRSIVARLDRRLGMVYAVALVTAVTSPFLLNDVIVIILTPVIVSYAKDHGVDPVPLIVAEITFTNISSSLTPIGNPQNILLWSASGVSFVGFIEGTWWRVLVSGLISGLVLLPFAMGRRDAGEVGPPFVSKVPGVYLGVVAAAVVISDLITSKPYLTLGVAFLLGFVFTFRKLRRVYQEFDFRALGVLYLFVIAVTVVALLVSSSIVPVAVPVSEGVQPYSAVFFALASNIISNVPATQLVISTAGVGASVAPKLAVAAGLAGNLGPIASFANLLALQISRRAGVSVKRAVLLQLLVGLASFVPALL